MSLLFITHIQSGSAQHMAAYMLRGDYGEVTLVVMCNQSFRDAHRTRAAWRLTYRIMTTVRGY